MFDQDVTSIMVLIVWYATRIYLNAPRYPERLLYTNPDQRPTPSAMLETSQSGPPLPPLLLVFVGPAAASSALSVAVRRMVIHLGWHVLSSTVVVILVLMLLGILALMLMLEVLVNCDSATDDDCLLDETH